MRLFDAHNHLQSDRLAACLDTIASEVESSSIVAMVVNGTTRRDWDRVKELSERWPWVVPAVGFHPWYLASLPSDWSAQLEDFLDTCHATVGEIGIDRWRTDIDNDLQEEVFRRQLHIAQARSLPVSIHGLKAWTRVLEILTDVGDLPGGFLLHSYTGPRDLIKPFVERGGYFSLSGASLSPKRHGDLSLFGEIPFDRILVETDAPDQLPPDALDRWKLHSPTDGERMTHPLSIELSYAAVAHVRGVSLEAFSQQVDENFRRLFGRFVTQAPRA
jgi:TatD DNase family protein